MTVDVRTYVIYEAFVFIMELNNLIFKNIHNSDFDVFQHLEKFKL